MKVERLFDIIGADFYTGVPDSQLRALCDFLMSRYGTDPKHHIIAANEGNSTAIAAGYHLATGRVPVVYMQNSGEGNIINPVASLLNDRVYAIPVIFIIGWRGEPGIHDEPQHIYQGEVTLKLLNDMDIRSFVIGRDTSEDELRSVMGEFRTSLAQGKDVAFVIRKGALENSEKVVYKNDNTMKREDIIRHIVEASGEDPIVSTTGKASRELFEIREANGQSHKYDFLTVGSMGHSSSIALGVALNKPDRRVWCIDGDGAALMHMGAMAVIGANKPENLIHVVINNGAHETVGGMPTVAESIDLTGIAKACGYPYASRAESFEALDSELEAAKRIGELSLIEVACSIGARDDLGRPTTTAAENKQGFMGFLGNMKLCAPDNHGSD
ncbi:MAG: phosphonopyruvate decarboxylase [Clostridia bacterium]|nr:phosphonopyruvate decarboxylase [Clostridia bacterium]